MSEERITKESIEEEVLKERLGKCMMQVKEQEAKIRELELQVRILPDRNTRLSGENEALRFVIRCNGVSGAEVVK